MKQTTGTPQQLIEQARAAYALKWLELAQQQSGIKKPELKSYVRRLPGMIQMNGFGQAMAFYYSQSQSDRPQKEAYRQIYELVNNWLCTQAPHHQQSSSPVYGDGKNGLMAAITSHDQQLYRQAQAETLALLRWVKKFAEALIIEEASSD